MGTARGRRDRQAYQAANKMLNEFKMAWDLRDRFPLHFIVFKQTAAHLPHEANVEQRSSRDAMKIHS